jgi:hypothetical protein
MSLIAAITIASGALVAIRMQETHRPLSPGAGSSEHLARST